jgi:hypothetical protein
VARCSRSGQAASSEALSLSTPGADGFCCQEFCENMPGCVAYRSDCAEAGAATIIAAAMTDAPALHLSIERPAKNSLTPPARLLMTPPSTHPMMRAPSQCADEPGGSFKLKNVA